MIRAVIIGFAHMHVNEIALYISGQPDFELAGVADVQSGVDETGHYRYTAGWNLENVRKNYCSAVYGDYIQMLEEIKPEIAFILTENCMKPAVVEECAKRGVNVCIEKPVAVSLNEAKKIENSVKKYGIEAVVNWPVAWRPYLHKMKQALDAKIVGEPLELRYINGHTGPLGKGAKHRGVAQKAQEMTDEIRAKSWWYREAFGGGVFLDISCYGCFFSKWLMGNGEKSILAYGTNLNTPYGDVEDNFAAIIKYDHKMSVIEGTWTTPRAVIPSGPMVICSQGVVMCTGGAENAPDVKAFDIYGNELELPEYAEKEKFRNMCWHYAEHVKTKEAVHEMLTLEKNMEIMAMIDAIIRSSRNGSGEMICE